MRWFKHMTDATRDDKLIGIRATFGVVGIAWYWILLEAVAERMKGRTPDPTRHFMAQELCSLLGVKRKVLTSFLEHCQNVLGMKVECSENIIIISVPKLLEIKDNYQKDLEDSGKKLPSIEVEGEREVERDTDKDKIKDKTVRKRTGVAFAPPTHEEASQYRSEKGYSFSIDAWFNHYEANGWMVGRNKMKNWRAAMAQANAQGWFASGAKPASPGLDEVRRKQIANLKIIQG